MQPNNYWQPNEVNQPQQQSSPPPDPLENQPPAEAPVDEVVPSAETESAAPLMQDVSWEASEFVHHEKDMMWYVGVVAVSIVLLGLSIWLHAWTFTALIVVMVAAIFFMSLRPPRVLHYQLSSIGLRIDSTPYDYKDFRAFGLVQDDAMYYITLLPIKRFMPAIDIYFPQEYGEQIVDALGTHVPMQTIKPDAIDKLMKRLRF